MGLPWLKSRGGSFSAPQTWAQRTSLPAGRPLLQNLSGQLLPSPPWSPGAGPWCSHSLLRECPAPPPLNPQPSRAHVTWQPPLTQGRCVTPRDAGSQLTGSCHFLSRHLLLASRDTPWDTWSQLCGLRGAPTSFPAHSCLPLWLHPQPVTPAALASPRLRLRHPPARLASLLLPFSARGASAVPHCALPPSAPSSLSPSVCHGSGSTHPSALHVRHPQCLLGVPPSLWLRPRGLP